MSRNLVQSIEELQNQPLRHIPNVKVGEVPVSDNAGLPPPDQKDLIEPDFEAVPHPKDAELTDIEQLEALGQQRLLD